MEGRGGEVVGEEVLLVLLVRGQGWGEGGSWEVRSSHRTVTFVPISGARAGGTQVYQQ